MGGKKTGKPGMLIYAMEVNQALSFPEFSRLYKKEAGYYSKHNIPAGARVLVSKHFYYFGDHAKPLLP